MHKRLGKLSEALWRVCRRSVKLPSHSGGTTATRQTFRRAVEGLQRPGRLSEAFWRLNNGVADFPNAF
ncbi:hypothetical protein WJR50_19650 [Catalinimonas sp. 4WD22]|uniref:hypothetical protein n=1 Tax=Catalinimonas locisalis TaxID=3133978 RepID=UPI003100C914